MAKYDGIIFDVDGTLVDSNDAHARAYVEAMHACGFSQATFEQIRPLIGMGGDQLLPRAIGIEKDSLEGEAVQKKRGEIYKAKYADTVKPTQGASELTARLKADGFRLIIASSGEEDEVKHSLELAGVLNDIDLIVSGKDAPKSKPHPMSVQVALYKANLAPEDALFIGDTPYDVEAGEKAGVAVCSVRCGGYWGDDKLRADYTFDSPADLLAHYNEVFKK